MTPFHRSVSYALSRRTSHTLLNRAFSTSNITHTQRSSVFKLIENNVEPSDEMFKTNMGKYQEMQAMYEQLKGMALQAGGEKSILRHTEQNKKILAWERLKLLFDEPENVLELSTLAGLGMPYGNIARAGIIISIGKIQGVYCMVIANDATVKAGTLFPITVKKQLRAQEIAEQNHIPCVYVVDSGGAFLPLQGEIFTNGGRGFYNEAILNSKGIPQLAIVCGSCTAGAAYVPTMSQEALIVHKIGTIFLGGPPLVYAALGEVVSPEKLGGATLHSTISGCTDHFSGTEEEAFETSRDIVPTFNIEPQSAPTEYSEPLYDPMELGGIIPNENQHNMDMYQVIARIVDGSGFQEFKARYGTNLVTGFAFIQGFLVGIVGNHGAMTEKAALKGAHFVQMCSQRKVPLIFLQNSVPESEHMKQLAEAGGMKEHALAIKGHAKLMSSVACANVPIITVIVGNSFGVDNYMMAGRAFDPHFVFSWPNARICMRDPEETEQYLSSQQYIEDDSSQTDDLTPSHLPEHLEEQSSAFYATARVWDDGIILPQDTRQVIAKCLDIINQKKGVNAQDTAYGVLRM